MKIQNRLIRKMTCSLLSFSLLVLGACEYSPSAIVSNWGKKIDVLIFSPESGSEWVVDQMIEIHSMVSAPNVVHSMSLIINGEVLREDVFAHPTFTRGSIMQPWTPTKTGVFTIQVVLRDANDMAESNVVTILVIEPAEGPGRIDGVDDEATGITSTLTVEPTFTFTPAPEGAQATTNQNLNCRLGPDMAYETAWFFPEGHIATITGVNDDGNWLLIERGDGEGECWVSRYYVSVTGNLSLMPVITPMPLLPTHTATVTESPYSGCADYPDMATCNQDPMGFGGCTWDTGLNACQP